MTPKEKAKELVSKYVHLAKQSSGAIGTIYNAKQCALIAVDEILTALDEHQWQNRSVIEFYFSVKQEIEKL
jgi:hypothetical protein